MRLLSLPMLLLAALFLTGCPKSTPKTPSVLARVIAYETSRFESESGLYYTAINNNQPEQARRFRDRIIFRLKGSIDANYHEFESQLFTGRATANVLFDIVEFGSGVATTITNGERAKSIISAALTGFKGGRRSLDENFFRERTTAVIISQMQASRARVETTILSSVRQLDVDQYSLEAALGDLINYFYAGTLQKGLQELAQQTGQQAINEKNNVRGEREKLRPGTPESAARAIKIRDRFNQLFKDAITPPIDLEKQAAALLIAKRALQELTGQAVPNNISNADVFTQLDDAIEAVATDETGIQRVRSALQIN